MIIEEKGCKLEFLPPYYLDFNPIEYFFSVIKRALCERYEYRSESPQTLQELANKVLRIAKEVVTPELARNQFRHCNIKVDYN